MLTGGKLEAYTKHVLDLKKKASTVFKAVVGIEMKTKKWKDCPPAVTAFVTNKKSAAKAMVEGLGAFSGVRKSSDMHGMEQALANIDAAGAFTTPTAFRVLYFKEKGRELTLFGALDDFCRHVTADGFASLIQGAAEHDLRDLRADVIGDALKILTGRLADTFENSNTIGELCFKLLEEGGGSVVDEETDCQLSMLVVALTDKTSEHSTFTGGRAAAIKSIAALLQAENQNGVLSTMVREPKFKSLVGFLRAGSSGTSVFQDRHKRWSEYVWAGCVGCGILAGMVGGGEGMVGCVGIGDES